MTKKIKIALLLISVILGWGLSWPFAKIGLYYIPPMSFVFIRLFIGTFLFFIFLGTFQKITLPKRDDFPVLLTVGLNQIALFSLLLTLGLAEVDANRSAILSYITPLWVFPIAHFFLKEVLSPAKILGITIGFIGVFIMLNPITFDWSNKKALWGNMLLILASISWALQIIFLKYYQKPYSALKLMPWQLLLATLAIFPFALFYDGVPFIDWELNFNFEMLFMVFFGGIVTMGYCYWASIELNKLLPANTLSIALLSVPVAGFFLSMLILGEKLIFSNLLGLIFILSGIAFAFTKKQQQTKK